MERHFITATESGERLDRFIARHLPFLSRTRIRDMIHRGSVYIDKTRVRRNSRAVRTGETVLVHIPGEPPLRFSLNDIGIIHEEKGFVVVNKPSGLPADETRTDVINTVPGLLAGRYPHNPYLQTVHRLDAGTSGVMILSRKRMVTKFLNAAFREKQVEKVYLAQVMGRLEKKTGRITGSLARDRNDPRRFRVVKRGGKPSVTTYDVIRAGDRDSLVRVVPRTGRTHQIRVHFAHAGHPLAGDWLYGDRTTAPRLMLHAWRLTLTHPVSGERVTFEAAAPETFQ